MGRVGMMRFEVKWNKPKSSKKHTPTHTQTHTQTLVNHKCVTNSIFIAINDRTIVFEYQPMSAHLEYAWPSSLAIVHDQQSA